MSDENAKLVKDDVLTLLGLHQDVVVEVLTGGERVVQAFRDLIRSKRSTPFHVMQHVSVTGSFRDLAINTMNLEYREGCLNAK